MARGSIGRERMMSGVVGISAHQPPASGHQEDLNNELNKVSRTFECASCPLNVTKTPANCQFADRIAILTSPSISRQDFPIRRRYRT